MKNATENLVEKNTPVKKTRRARGPYRDLTGKVFGRLTILRIGEPAEWGGIRWVCKCECGNEKLICGNDITRTHRTPTRSCGCLATELFGLRNTTHGQNRGGKRSASYLSWCAMKNRCLNPNSTNHQDYMARGIKICQRWIDSFQDFSDDMGPRPRRMSIDRIDNSGNYEPGNCRWGDDFVQHNNTRANKFITFRGKTLTISQWARVVNLPPTLVWHRLNRGWTAEDALTVVPNLANKHVNQRKIQSSLG